MLHKSFKPAKCKTALKLAVSRIKLLKNKKDAQVKQQKRELAQLLEAGQERTARIRVEHVVREEKTMAAFDLIEIYCELIVARLPIIESQKNCPIDLKEAIASVIFASPRCADIPELMDVRKLFTAKYGKEFVASAIEIRPDCGVSRLLIEKLSAKAPDGPTKMKILSVIAEQHNVKWDPESIEENEMKPSEDLLNGPNTFGQASKMHVESSNFQESPNGNDRFPPGASSKHYERHDAPVNSYGSNSRSSYSQNHPSVVDANNAMPSGTSHPDPRLSGNTSNEMESKHFYAAGQGSSSTGRQNWTMEFKDATSAAQAAAESAERASMAARAAAELSSQGRITRQPSVEPNKASDFRSMDEEVKKPVSSRSKAEHIAKGPAQNTAFRSNAGMHYDQTYEDEQDDELAKLSERFNNLKNSSKPTPTASSKSSSSSAGDYSQGSDFRTADRHSRDTPSTVEKSDVLGEASMKRESSESEDDFAGEAYNDLRSENVGYSEQASIRKQSSNVSSHSNSQIPGDDFNVFSNSSQQKFSEDVFSEHSIFDKENVGRNTEESNVYGDAGLVFDDSGSEDDMYKFDMKHEDNDQDSSSYFLSESRKSSSHILGNTSTQSPGLTTVGSRGNSNSKTPFFEESKSIFAEGSASDAIPAKEGGFLPVTFDDSDGPGSDSEEELHKSEPLGRKQIGTFPDEDISYSSHPETPETSRSSLAEKVNMRSNRNTGRQGSVVDSGVEVEVHSPVNQGTEVHDGTDRKFDEDYFLNNQASYRTSESHSKSNDYEKISTSGISSAKYDMQGNQSLDTSDDDKPVEEQSFESGSELGFGKLTGGLRNKGYKHPPYRRNALEKQSVSRPAEDLSTRIDQSSSSLKVDSGFEGQEQIGHRNLNEKSSLGVPYSDNRKMADEERPQKTIYSSQEPYMQKPSSTEMNKRSGLNSYFDSDNSDSEEDIPKKTGTSKKDLSPVFSRRTKAASSNPRRNSSMKSSALSESSITTGSLPEKKSFSPVSSYAAETPAETPSENNSSHYRLRSEQSSRTEQPNSRPSSQSKRSSRSTESQQNRSSQSKSFEQNKAAESSKPVSESKRPSREENRNSHASSREQASNPPPRTVAESTKTTNSRAEAPSRENSIDKASHVHPKLPDYDTITAHLLSLRQNRP
ncbi:Regulator of Vps4 activity in the MVB pathway protein [Euphorbia peplus]|nr:Regulator of Vps4 activity in the MVB pathway protein [Euphorbia peplus]